MFEPGATTKDFTPTLETLDGNKENYKLYRIPGFDNILVKAVPKIKSKTNLTNEDNAATTTTPPSELEKEREPAVAILESYLGTKTMNDTVKALQGVRDMLQSGVLTAQREAADERPKETVFVIPPMTPVAKFQPIVTKPTKVPVTPFLSHVYKLPSPPALLVNRHMIRMPLAPLPTLPSLPSIPSYLVPRLMKPVNIVDMPIQPFVNSPPIFVEPSNVAVKSYPYPYKPCCESTVAIPAKSSYVIEEKIPVIRPPMLVKHAVVVPRPPSIIVDRLEKIAGGKIFTQRPVIALPPFVLASKESIDEQSKFINVDPLSATWISPVALTNGNASGQHHSYKIVNKDGTVTTFSKLLDNVDDFGYNVNMESDDGYYQTDDGRIFYSRLVKDPSLEMTKDFQDEIENKHRKNQYTVTNVEEFKNVLNRDDVQVMYGTDKDNDPFLSYRVPSGGYSFMQLKNFSKIKDNNLLPLMSSGGIKEPSDKSTTTEKGIVLPSGPSKYSFKQIHDDGSITEYVAYDSTNPDVAVLQNVQDTEENLKSKIPLPGAEVNDPTFIFKPINLNNLQSAAGQLESAPTRLDDKDKVNAHEHVSPDNVVHSVPLSIQATMPSPVGLSSTVPKDFLYIPPKADVPFLSSHKAANQRPIRNNSFKMTDSGATLEPFKSTNNDNQRFSNTNPIVVQNEEDESRSRGDVPEAFS